MEADSFYVNVKEIQQMKSDESVKFMKDACDKLLKNVKMCLSDEAFVHEMHDRWGIGLD